MAPPDLNPPASPPPLPKHHLFGSKPADILVGLFVGIAWWGIWAAVAKLSPDASGVVAVILAPICFVQLIVVGSCTRSPGRFLISQIVTLVLTPLIAVGLLFGACLLGGGGLDMR